MENTVHSFDSPAPSDRKFGWTFTGLFLVVGIFHPWLMPLAAVTALVTATRAQWLGPLNRGWMKLGAAMHMVVSPIIMGLMFFGLFTPMGWVMRRFGWDAMKRAYEPEAKTYWIKRDPAGPADDSFKNLF